MLLSRPSWTAQAVMPKKLVQPDCPTEAQNTDQLHAQGTARLHAGAACCSGFLFNSQPALPTCPESSVCSPPTLKG